MENIEKNLKDILTKNGFHSILYYTPDQKIKKIDCNPWILNKRELIKDLDEYIKNNLISIDEDSQDDLLTNYNESLKKNKDDPNRYIALLEIALATDTYKKKLQSENELREKTHINNLDFVALSSLVSKTPLDSIPEDNLYQELSEKANLKHNHQEPLIKKQKENASYKEILINNIESLEETYKNDDLENNVDDMLNFAFSAITSLASSLLCCASPPSRPKTIIYRTVDKKATILNYGRGLKQYV